MMPIKIFGGVCIAILVVNIILFAMGKIGQLLFWFIIILMAFVAYYIVPRIYRPESLE
tara:strand:+ start:193 stop:366 length:174 start_codon:yes stop_codon:yes gene_type:complete